MTQSLPGHISALWKELIFPVFHSSNFESYFESLKVWGTV